MRFSELTEPAQRRAYGEYVVAMADEWNMEDVLPMVEYGAAADWDGLEFCESGEVVI